jgi:hypothetical protein
LSSPVERHQIVFLNPDLAGLFTAYLSLRAGADIAIVDETARTTGGAIGYPTSFPAGGTYNPGDVDVMAVDSGFPPPVWERIPALKIYIGNLLVELNSDDGTGGMLLAVGRAIPLGRSVWTQWLQEQFKRLEELPRSDEHRRMTGFRRLEKSVASSILSLHLPEPDNFLGLMDTLAILTTGRGIVQLDLRDFALVLAGFLKGWHMPARGEQDWSVSIARRLRRDGARWLDVESVQALQSFSDRNSLVRCSDGTLLASNILVFPTHDRYRLPTKPGPSSAIRWENWYGRAMEHNESEPRLAVLRPNLERAPVNDNFVTTHLRPDSNGLFTASAPIEQRYVSEEESGRWHTVESRVRFLIREKMGWHIEDFTGTPGRPAGPDITVPGTVPSVSYPEGPMWGDDVFTRLKAADRLSTRIVNRIR